MLPAPEHAIVFLLAIWPLCVAHVILHEAGHMLAARLAGLPVLAWGVGFQRPRVRLRVGQNFFYIGRPLGGGLTLYCRPLIEPRRWAEFATVLGGPVASLVGLGLGLFAWIQGARSDVLTAWIYVSAIYCLASWIPFTSRKAGLTFDNDARLLWNLLMHGTAGRQRPLGASVGTQVAIATLLDQVGNRAGAAYVRLGAANLAAALGATEVARRWYDEAQGVDLTALATGEAFRAFITASMAVETAADDAEQRIEQATEACRFDPTASFLLATLRQRVRLRRGESIDVELAALGNEAQAARRPEWQAMVDVLAYDANPAADEAALDALLARHQPHLLDVSRASMLAMAIERLVQAGNIAVAQARFAAAEQALLAAAGFIADAEVRQAFLQRGAAPLDRAHAACPEQIPKFADEPPIEAAVVRPKPTFTQATLFFGVSMLLFVAIAALLIQLQIRTSTNRSAGVAAFLLLLGWLGSLLAGLIATVRRERRGWYVLLGLLLTTVALMLAAAGGVTSPGARKSRRPLEAAAIDCSGGLTHTERWQQV